MAEVSAHHTPAASAAAKIAEALALHDKVKTWEASRRQYDEMETKSSEEWFAKVVNETQFAKQILQELLKFLKEKISADHNYASQLTQFSKYFTPASGTVMGPLADTWSAMKLQNQKLAECYTSIVAAMHDNVMPLMTTALQNYDRTSQSIVSEVKKQIKDLDRERQNVNKAYQNYESAVKDMAGAAQVQQPSNSKDPWLSEVAYRAALVTLFKQRQLCTQQIIALTEKLAALEEGRIEGIKGILQAYNTKQQLLFSKLQEALKGSLLPIDSLDPVKGRTALLTNLTSPRSDQPAPQPPTQAPDLDLLPKSKVIKEGWLLRQSSVIKSWKRNYFVISPYGFMHYFASQEDTKPEETFPLTQCTIHYTGNGQMFEVVREASGLLFKSVTKLSLKAVDEEQMVDWIVEMKKFAALHQHKEDAKPEPKPDAAQDTTEPTPPDTTNTDTNPTQDAPASSTTETHNT